MDYALMRNLRAEKMVSMKNLSVRKTLLNNQGDLENSSWRTDNGYCMNKGVSNVSPY